MDPAFQSRITVALRYDALDIDSRARVWKNLLQGAELLVASSPDKSRNNSDRGEERSEPKCGIDIDVLAQYQLNGREIKNAVRLAMALAREDGKTQVDQNELLETVCIHTTIHTHTYTHTQTYIYIYYTLPSVFGKKIARTVSWISH